MDKSKYNCSCPECGADAYRGLMKIACSNSACKFFDKNSVKEEVSKPPMNPNPMNDGFYSHDCGYDGSGYNNPPSTCPPPDSGGSGGSSDPSMCPLDSKSLADNGIGHLWNPEIRISKKTYGRSIMKDIDNLLFEGKQWKEQLEREAEC